MVSLVVFVCCLVCCRWCLDVVIVVVLVTCCLDVDVCQCVFLWFLVVGDLLRCCFCFSVLVRGRGGCEGTVNAKT